MSGYDEGTGNRTRGIGKWVVAAGCAVLVLFCLMLGNCSTGTKTDMHDSARQRHSADAQSGWVTDGAPEPENWRDSEDASR